LARGAGRDRPAYGIAESLGDSAYAKARVLYAVQEHRIDPVARLAFDVAVDDNYSVDARVSGDGMSFEEGMKCERGIVVALADTPDFAEGVDTFLQTSAVVASCLEPIGQNRSDNP
jgi:hypothetical protein